MIFFNGPPQSEAQKIVTLPPNLLALPPVNNDRSLTVFRQRRQLKFENEIQNLLLSTFVCFPFRLQANKYHFFCSACGVSLALDT